MAVPVPAPPPDGRQHVHHRHARVLPRARAQQRALPPGLPPPGAGGVRTDRPHHRRRGDDRLRARPGPGGPAGRVCTVATVVAMVIGLFVLVLVAQPLVAWKVGLIAAMGGLFVLAMPIPGRAGSSPSSSRRRPGRGNRHRRGGRSRGGRTWRRRGGASERPSAASVVSPPYLVRVEAGQLAAQPAEPRRTLAARTSTKEPNGQSYRANAYLLCPASRPLPVRRGPPARCGPGCRRRHRGSQPLPGGRAPGHNGGPPLADRVVISRQASARSKPSGRTTGSSVRSTDDTRSIRKVRSPASVSPPGTRRCPCRRPSGCTTRRLRPVAVDVAEATCTPSITASCRTSRAAGAGGRPVVPTDRVDDDGARAASACAPERLRQGTDELAQRGLHLRGRRRGGAGHQEKGAGLRLGQPAQVGPAAARQPPAAVAALEGVDGHAGHPQGVEVAAGRALGHLQLGCHLGRGHLPRAWRSRRMATRRSARTAAACHENRSSFDLLWRSP